MKDIRTIKGAIFDCDGTLLDSMEMWSGVETRYLISLGGTPRPGLSEDLRMLGGTEVPRYFQTEYRITLSISDMKAGLNAMMEDFYFTEVPLKDGVASALKTLFERGFKMCVATATDRYLVEAALQRCGVLGYFGRVFSCGDGEKGKRSPEIYLHAADFLGTSPGETLVIEDALYAMSTAKKAGFPVAAVYDPSSDDQQHEIRELCDYYLTTIDEMLKFL